MDQAPFPRLGADCEMNLSTWTISNNGYWRLSDRIDTNWSGCGNDVECPGEVNTTTRFSGQLPLRDAKRRTVQVNVTTGKHRHDSLAAMDGRDWPCQIPNYNACGPIMNSSRRTCLVPSCPISVRWREWQSGHIAASLRQTGSPIMNLPLTPLRTESDEQTTANRT